MQQCVGVRLQRSWIHVAQLLHLAAQKIPKLPHASFHLPPVVLLHTARAYCGREGAMEKEREKQLILISHTVLKPCSF